MITDKNKVFNEICIQNFNVVIDNEEKYKNIFNRVLMYASGMKSSSDFWLKERKASMDGVNQQLFYSKLNEFFDLKFAVTKLGFPKDCKIDLEIREGGNKGWFVDLPFNDIDKSFPNVHCKSCNNKTLKIAGDYSWTLQFKNNDNGYGRDPLFDKPESMDLVFFSHMEKGYRKATVKATAPWKLVYPLLKNPVLKKLSDIKQCVYYSDLVNQSGGKND
jgi:hypothetical protein